MTYKAAFRQNTALWFDGTSHLSMSTPGAGIANANPAHNEAFSISAWVAANSYSTETIWTNHGGNSDPGFALQYTSSGQVRVRYPYSASTSTVTTQPRFFSSYGPSQFQCVVFTYDGSASTAGFGFYMNNYRDFATNTGSNTVANCASTSNIKIGFGTASGGTDTEKAYNKIFSNIAIWSKVLDGHEVGEIYHGLDGSIGPGNLLHHSAASNLVGWYIASHPSDSATGTIHDRSGQGNNFTANNFTAAELLEV